MRLLLTSAAPTPTADQVQWQMLNGGDLVLLVGLVLTAMVTALAVVILARTVSRATEAA